MLTGSTNKTILWVAFQRLLATLILHFTVQNIIKRIKKNGEATTIMQHIGAPKKLNEREDERQLVAITRKDLFAKYGYIDLLWLRIHQINISGSRLIRYLKHVDFDSYFTAYKPALFEEDRKRRLPWAKERVNWAMGQWNSVDWSDKPRYTNKDYGGGASVLCNVGDRYHLQHIVPTRHNGAKTV